MKETTQVDRWINILKNKKLIAFVVVLFIISIAGLKWMNEFSKFKSNYIDEERKVDSIVNSNNNAEVEVTSNEKSKKANEEKELVNEESKIVFFSTISGRLVDANGNGIPDGLIAVENGEGTLTDENGFFKLKIKIRPEQLKVKIFFKKEGIGQKMRYVGSNQKNIVLKL